MEIPIEIFIVFLLISIGCSLYLLFIHDRNNYSEAIAGVLAVIFWIITGLTLFVGVVAQNGLVIYQSTAVGWIFIAIGAIVGLITFVKILDIIVERRKEKNNTVNLSPIRL